MGTRTVSPRGVVTVTRRRKQDESRAVTHEFSVDGHRGIITVGLNEEGQPVAISVAMDGGGLSTVAGFTAVFARAVTLALQSGASVESVVERFILVRFEPSGTTQNPHIGVAESIADYVARWLKLTFLSP